MPPVGFSPASNNPSLFKPKLTFSKWNGEESFSLEGKLLNFVSKSFIDGNILIENNDFGFYLKSEDTENVKFGLILKKKPPANSFSLELTGYENFDFFYQPVLANVEPDGSSWEDNGRGGRFIRPADVGGSYAVYHKTKRDYMQGETNYKTGKVVHIYRPKFIDALDNWAWADLLIENGSYIITISSNISR